MKTWVRPQGVVEEFVANEYVAACIKFECVDSSIAGNGLYIDSNNDGHYRIEDDEMILYYHRKNGETLYLPENAPLQKGWFKLYPGTPVVIYKSGSTYHIAYSTTTTNKS